MKEPESQRRLRRERRESTKNRIGKRGREGEHRPKVQNILLLFIKTQRLMNNKARKLNSKERRRVDGEATDEEREREKVRKGLQRETNHFRVKFPNMDSAAIPPPQNVTDFQHPLLQEPLPATFTIGHNPRNPYLYPILTSSFLSLPSLLTHFIFFSLSLTHTLSFLCASPLLSFSLSLSLSPFLSRFVLRNARALHHRPKKEINPIQSDVI